MSRASWSSSDEEDGQEGVEVIENEDGSCQEAEHDTVRLLNNLFSVTTITIYWKM